MATAPTPEEAAKYILEIMTKKFSNRAGQGIMQGSLTTPFTTAPWQVADLNAGLQYAEQQKWIERRSDGFLKLTQAGFDVA